MLEFFDLQDLVTRTKSVSCNALIGGASNLWVVGPTTLHHI
jgi:hypothetical protein